MTAQDPLFSENFPPFSNDEELKELQDSLPHLDPYYIATAQIEERRKIFEEMWKLFKPYTDSDWSNRARKSFHRFSWEVLIGYMFILNRFKLRKHLNIGPDVILDTENVYIECVAVDKGELSSPDRVPDVVLGRVFNLPIEKTILRITNSIDNKKKQYDSWSKNSWFNPSAPYVLAVNLSDLESVPGLYGIPIVVSSAFGMGDLSLNLKTGKSSWTIRDAVEKFNKTSVPTAFFLNPEYDFISGIISTNHPVISTEILESVSYVANPNAQNPVDINLFNFMECWIIDKEGYLKKIPALPKTH